LTTAGREPVAAEGACVWEDMQIDGTFPDAEGGFIEKTGENQTSPYLRTVPGSDINKDRTITLSDPAILSSLRLEE